MRSIKYIGSAIGNCGQIKGCEQAPACIFDQLSDQLSESDFCNFSYQYQGTDFESLNNYFTQVATHSKNVLSKKHFPVFLGGDHSSAIGTWSGVSSFASEQDQEIGLIWIDAHLDAHIPQTSPSGNVHGMSVAHLLGFGDQRLCSILHDNPKLKPENIVYIGIRSFEGPDLEFVKKCGIKTYFQSELTEQNFAQILLSEFNRLALITNNVGISLDLDGLSSIEFKAVGTPVAGGISGQTFFDALSKIDFDKLIAFEIVEYNPKLDENHHSLQYLLKLINLLQTKLNQ